MKQYHKIQTVFKRDPAAHHKTLLEGEFSLPEFEYLQDNPWEFTEKVDGTNIRVMWEGEEIRFGGKTDNAQIPMTLIESLGKLFSHQVEKFHEMFGGYDTEPEGESVSVCLYGEGYGAKIQKGGGNYRRDQGFVLFDVKIGNWWLQRDNVVDISKKLDLDVVPLIGIGTIGEMIERTKEGFNSQWGNFRAEGIVARPTTEMCTRDGHRIITKLKCKDFRTA